jgi:hypothetical protein
MKNQRQRGESRLIQLLADRAVFGLKEKQEEELNERLMAMPEFDVDAMDLAAAMVPLAFLPRDLVPLPLALYAKIRSQALQDFFPFFDNEASDPDIF